MTREKHTRVSSKKHLARIERERKQNRMIMAGAIATLVIVLGLIGYGLANNYILKPLRTVAVINGEKVSLTEFQDQARLARMSLINQYNQYLQFAQLFAGDEATNSQIQSMLQSIEYQLEPTILGQGVLEQMVQDILVRQEAERRGITVSDEEVDKYFEEGFGYFPNGTPTVAPTTEILPTSTLNPTQLVLVPPTATPTITPTPVITQTATPTVTPLPTSTPDLTATAAPTLTPQPTATPLTSEGYNQQLADYFTNMESTAMVSKEVLREAVRNMLLRDKVKEAIIAEQNISHDQEQIWARHILVATESEAQTIIEELKAGQDFAELARQHSTDTASAANGGDLGWFGPGDMVAEFETAAYSLAIGEISEPVQTTYGYHIIQVLGRETRALSDSDYSTYTEKIFQEWLTNLRGESDVEIFENWRDDVPEEPALPTSG